MSTSSPRPPTAPPLRSPRYRPRRASAHRSSSRRIRFRARWPPPLPTSRTLARRRPPSRAGSDTRAGCSRIRAGAAARAIRGSSPTSARRSATSPRPASGAWFWRRSASSSITSRCSTTSTPRRARSLRSPGAATALPAARCRGPAGPHRRSLPQGLRLVPRPAAPAARRLSAAGAHAARPVRDVVAVLLARQGADGARSRAAARRRRAGRRRRREPRRVRAPPARRRGARARRPAAGRGHLHRRPGGAQRGGDDAALRRGRAPSPLGDPWAPALALLLGEIEYAGAATVSLGYRRADVPHPLDGFGFVVPRSEGKALLAATFSSVKYPGRAPAGHALIRCFMGGALDAETLREDDSGLVARARRELGDALGVTAEPVLVRASRWPASMPQYRVGHLARVEAIERCAAALPSLYLAGAAYRGVGIADCVRSGEAAADTAVC